MALAASSPWAFGGVQPWAVRTLTLAALATATGIVGIQLASGGVTLPRLPAWPIAVIVVAAAVQLLPLPPQVHSVVAPGSFEVWHPPGVAVAQVLGVGAHPISINPGATQSWIAWVSALVLLALVAIPAATVPRQARAVASILAASGALVAVYGIVARVAFGPLVFGLVAVPTVAPFGPFVSKNHFAGYVEMAGLLSLGLASGLAAPSKVPGSALGWVASVNSPPILMGYAGFCAAMLAVLVSLSRGGVIGLIGGIGIFFIVRAAIAHGKHGPVVRTLVAVVLSLFTLMLLLPSEAHDRFSSFIRLGDETSASLRVRVWRDSLYAFIHSPLFGYGAGTFADAIPRFKSASGLVRVEHAENDYIELLVELGLTGFVGTLLTSIAGIRLAVAGYRLGRHRLFRRLGPGAVAGLAALAIHGLFDFNLRIPSNATLFTCLALLAVATADPVLIRCRRIGWLVFFGCALTLAMEIHSYWVPSPPRLRSVAVADANRAALAVSLADRRLRAVRAEATTLEWLRGRPAEPEPWLILAWLRAIEGDTHAASELAAHAVSLDPTSEVLAEQAHHVRATSQ